MKIDHIILGGRRAGKTVLAKSARYEFTLKYPNGVTIEMGPSGVRVEKPVSAADLVPELEVRDEDR